MTEKSGNQSLSGEQLEELPLDKLTELCFEGRSFSDQGFPMGYLPQGSVPSLEYVIDIRPQMLARNQLERRNDDAGIIGKLSLRSKLRVARQVVEIPTSAVSVIRVSRQINMDWASPREYKGYHGREYFTIRDVALAYRRQSGGLEPVADSEGFIYTYRYLVASPTGDPRQTIYEERKWLVRGHIDKSTDDLPMPNEAELPEAEAKRLILDYVLPPQKLGGEG